MAVEGKLKVTIVTPGGEKFDGEADEVVAPGFLGQFGPLPEHIEFFTKNPPGVLTVIDKGKSEVWAIGKGFIEVGPDRVQLLVQSAERAEEIETDRAAKARDKAVAGLDELEGNLQDPMWDHKALRLKRAEARLEAAETAK